MGSEKQSRNINLDLIRLIAMIFVIMVHIPFLPYQNNKFIANTFRSLFLSCNSLFFMLSGYFNLSYVIKKEEDYSKYYFKKFFSIFLPYFLVSFVIHLWKVYVLPHKKIEVLLLLKTFYKCFMSNSISTHLWFMYPLIGYLISAPFLGNLFQKMTNKELSLLFKIAIIWNIISIYLSENLGIEYSYSGWFLSGWIISFFAGYYCRRVINDDNKKILYLVGIIGFLITVSCEVLFLDNFNHSNDFSIAFVLFAMALSVFIEKEIKIKTNFLKNIIFFLGRYSFLIYLFLWNVLFDIVLNIMNNSNSVINFLLITLLTVVFSLIFSIATDLFILKPIKRLLLKVFNYFRNSKFKFE